MIAYAILTTSLLFTKFSVTLQWCIKTYCYYCSALKIYPQPYHPAAQDRLPTEAKQG